MKAKLLHKAGSIKKGATVESLLRRARTTYDGQRTTAARARLLRRSMR